MVPPISGKTNPDVSRRLAGRLFGIIVLCRALYLIPFLQAFDLAADESYYWAWGQRLDWGYFSKPPMIGWLMGIVGRLSGNTEWGVRLASLLLGSISLWLLYKLADKMFGARVGLLAMLLGALTPANAGLNLLLTIDSPLVLCWTAALLVFWCLFKNPERTGLWVLLSVVLGLGHLSKQMMLVFPLLMVAFCLLNAEAKPLLRRHAFWWCIGMSFLFLTPPVIWNAQHDWVTLKHTGSHFQTKPDSTFVDHLAMFGSFFGLQAAIFSPLTWLLLVAASFGGLWKWRVLDARERYLVLFSAPALAVFVLLSLRQNVNANWPAVYYLGAVVLAAAWLSNEALSVLPWQKLRRLERPALWVGLGCTVALYVLPIALGFTSLAGTSNDPAIRLRGWREVGEQAQGFFDKVPRPDRTFVVAMGERDNASQLGFYMPKHPPVFRFRPADVIESQYEIWPDPGDSGFVGGDALILRPKDDISLPPSLQRGFQEEIEKVGEIHVSLGRGGGERVYQVYFGADLTFWPGPPTAADIAKMQERAKQDAEGKDGEKGDKDEKSDKTDKADKAEK